MESGPQTPKEDGFLSRMALNDNKAGMEGLDRERINKIIMESSKGSKFYENEMKKDQQVNQRIEKMMLQKTNITKEQLNKAQAQVEKMASALERSRDLSRVIVHVDMDAFYAAVEMRDNPELKDKPMAVGSMSMLSTSNYHARKYGVRAAMPGFIAKKLCPDLVIVPPNFDKYQAVSNEIREIFADYDPHFQPLSLDEAFLDFTHHLEQRQTWPESVRTHCYSSTSITADEKHIKDNQEADSKDLSPVLFEDSCQSPPLLHGSKDAGESFEVFGTSVEKAVREMRFRIQQKTTLTASAGIAPNMMLAKVCSDKNKPNGQYRLPPTREAVMNFVQDLPVRKVCGIGKVSEKMLSALDITKCSHLGHKMALLSLLFSETACRNFMEVSLGLGSTSLGRHEERKSMSIERTFKELSNSEEQFRLCQELCEDLADDMKKEGLMSKTVTLKLKNVNFEVKTRALTLQHTVATPEEIFSVAKDLLKTEIENESPRPLRLRLMGVKTSAFVSSEGKHPLQKSILTFLQPGKMEKSNKSISRGDSQNLKGEVPQSSSQTSKTLALPPVQNDKGKEDILWSGNKLGEPQRDEEPQQSFFQRAHAKRLQSNTGAMDMQHKGGEVDAAFDTCEGESLDTDAMTNECVVPAQGCSHTSASETHARSLTCPVCFSLVQTSSLNVFNRHIDLCLNEASRKSRKHAHSWEVSGLEQENLHRECEEVSKHNRECEAEEKQPVSGGELSRVCQQESQCVEFSQKIERDNEPPTLQQSPSCDSKCPVLTCPVCQMTQDTDDLSIFNCHVDLCLNQEVLHELGGQATFSTDPSEVKKSKTTDGSKMPHKQASKGKSKRRDPPSSPPCKKPKSRGHFNTIDKFFR